MQKDAIVKISSILQSQKIPEGIRLRLENLNWKQQKNHRKPLKKQKNEKEKKLERKFFE